MIYVIKKDLKEIEETDLQELIDNEVIETKVLEYKETLPGNGTSNKKEFLADVSSFANASGGDILYGIKEDRNTGKPEPPLDGLNIQNVDSEINRLENILHHGLEPQIPSYLYTIWPIQLSNSNYVITIRIRKSWTGPHRIAFNEIHRFYSRNSNGKYMMDVQELRSAFTLNVTISEKVNTFREKRLSLIISGENYIRFNHNEILVLHLIPFDSFQPGVTYDISNSSILYSLEPIHASRYSKSRYNIDGVLSFVIIERSTPSELSYVQLYRNGIIEAAEDYIFQIPKEQGVTMMPLTEIEIYLIKVIPKYFDVYKKLGINPPISITLNIFGVKGWGVQTQLRTTYPVDRDHLQPPDVLIEDFNEPPQHLLRPIFDSLWNSVGFKESPNYEENGNWRINPIL